jgi:hypothetical protein
VAYRQLFAATFVTLGLAASACGGGGASSSSGGSGTVSEQPPASDDQPPGNPDQPPANPDQPPSGQTGGTVTTPGGSNECERFCDRYGDDCPGNNQASSIVRSLCNRGCDDLLAAQQCAPALGSLLACVVDLPGLCTEAGPSNADLQTCTNAYQAWTSCDNPDDDDNPPAMMPMGCTQAGGCDCADNCAACRCALGEANTTCDAVCP